MTKKILALMLSMAICIGALTGCKKENETAESESGSSDRVSESSETNVVSTLNSSSTPPKPTKEYIEIDNTKSEEYNAAIKAYNDFLNGKIDATDKTITASGKAVNINSICENNADTIDFFIADLDNNNIPELIVASNISLIRVYTFCDTVTAIAERNFYTKTLRYYSPVSSSYHGIFLFYTDFGATRCNYMTVQNNKVNYKEIKQLADDYSTDRQLLNESITVNNKNEEIKKTPYKD